MLPRPAPHRTTTVRMAVVGRGGGEREDSGSCAPLNSFRVSLFRVPARGRGPHAAKPRPRAPTVAPAPPRSGAALVASTFSAGWARPGPACCLPPPGACKLPPKQRPAREAERSESGSPTVYQRSFRLQPGPFPPPGLSRSRDKASGRNGGRRTVTTAATMHRRTPHHGAATGRASPASVQQSPNSCFKFE